MYTGWRRDLKYPKNRPLTVDEKRDVLSHKAASDPSFDERGGLVALNSTYIEWIDRRFRVRGSGTTFGSLLASLLCVAATAFFLTHGSSSTSGAESVASLLFTSIVFPVLGIVFFWRGWGIDFFQKRYWPIRFNRKNRMIYVYRDKRDGGILQVPWEDAYFHIGYGMMNPDLCDIRGEILDGDTVKDTFAVGTFYPDRHTEAVRETWAFICRYMEGGPEAVGPDPRDRFVERSLHGRWVDCLSVMHNNYPPNINVATFLIGWPMIVITAATRWLVLKTCRMPRWPADIEAACKVASDDPNIWPQPEYDNQFMMERKGVRDRWNERKRANARRRRPDSDLAKGMADFESAWQQRDKR